MRKKGGNRPVALDDKDDKSLQLINEIKAEPINKDDGVNSLYLAKLAYIKRKDIQELSNKEKALARKAYLSLLNKGETANSINSDKLADEMRRISQPEQRGPQPIMNRRRMMLQNMRPIPLPELGNQRGQDQDRRERVNMRGEDIEGMFANAVRGGKRYKKSMKKHSKKHNKKSMKKHNKKSMKKHNKKSMKKHKSSKRKH